LRGMTLAQKQLHDHFATLESMLADLKAKIDARPSTVRLVTPIPPPLDPAERLAAVRELLGARGSLTASDIQLELGVSHSTAVRAMRDVARAKDGVIVEEAAGPTYRIRLWHPDRVILDHQVER
jgi:hypothetical protein